MGETCFYHVQYKTKTIKILSPKNNVQAENVQNHYHHQDKAPQLHQEMTEYDNVENGSILQRVHLNFIYNRKKSPDFTKQWGAEH